jgi:hypothetical protein
MPSQGDLAGSGSRSGGSTVTSSVLWRRLASTATVPTAWAESRYTDGSPWSWRSLNRGNPMALAGITASRSPTRPNPTGSTASSPAGGASPSTAASTSASAQATVVSPTHSPGRSALNRTRTRAAPSTTWAAVSTDVGDTRYPEPRRSGPGPDGVTITSATRSGSIPAVSTPEPRIGASAPRARRRSRPRPSPRRPGAAAGRA